MKKLLILLLAAILLCGCAGTQSEKPSADESTSPLETTRTGPDRIILPAYSGFKHLNAVAVTWGEPVPEDDPDYYENILPGSGNTYIPVRVTYDEVFYSSFEICYDHYSIVTPDFPDSAIDGHSNHYIYVSKDVIDKFPAGKKQLIFLDYWNRKEETDQKTYYIDTRRNWKWDGADSFDSVFQQPIFDIIDGRIKFPDDYEEYILHPLDGTNKYFFSIFVDNANQMLKRDYPGTPLFEDGMLLSDFGPYIDRVLSYGN